MTHHDEGRKNAGKGHNQGTQQEPLSGSKKVKQKNHSRQNKHASHEM